jgi:hypothetical protein
LEKNHKLASMQHRVPKISEVKNNVQLIETNGKCNAELRKINLKIKRLYLVGKD